MKRKIGICSFIFSLVLTSFLLFSTYNEALAIGPGETCSPDASECDPGLSCQDLEGEGKHFQCEPPRVAIGSDCKVSEDLCVGLTTCIPNSPGSPDGKCGTVKEGSLCDPSQSESCGPSSTTPLACLPGGGGHTCQRVSCDPAKNGEDCKSIFKKPTYFCVPEGGGNFCKSVDVVHWYINVVVRTKESFKVPEDITYDVRLNVELKKNNNVEKILPIIKTITYKKDGTHTFSEKVQFGDVSPGKYEVCVSYAKICKDVEKIATEYAEVTLEVEPCDLNISTKEEDCDKPPPVPPPPCAESDGNVCRKFETSLGKIGTNPGSFISSVFAVLLAASGSIALLLIIRGGYKILTSQGNPDSVKEGRERIISAIVGLLFLIFSFVFLEVLGFNLLRIPFLEGSRTPTSANPLPASSSQTPGGSPSGNPGGNPGGSPTASDCSNQLLSLGSSGNCVKTLQEQLGGLTADGNFDTLTDAAVRKYQAENNIFVDGDVGPCTWGKILGKSVKPICTGPLNDATIRQFQTENGLVVNGVFEGSAGTCTWNAIMGNPIPDNCKKK